jgi:F-box-like
MSVQVSSISQSNEIGIDVLLMIFQHLDGEDLVKCEAVCRLWRDIVQSGTPWKKLFHRNKANFPLWRRAQRILESNQLTLRTDQYRDIYEDILQVGQNWRTGHLTKLTYPGDQRTASILTMSDDYVAWLYERRTETHGRHYGCAFLDTESMDITEFPSVWGGPGLKEMLVLWTDFRTRSAVEVRDPKSHWTVNVTNEEWPYSDEHQISFGSKLLVCYSTSRDNQKGFRIWKIGNPPTLLRTRICEDHKWEILKVDDQFIVVRHFVLQELEAKPRPLYFISTETLDIFTSLSVMRDYKYEYNRGLLFQSRCNGVIRILDLATGTFFNDVHLPYRKEKEGSVRLLYTWASSNSNVVVIGWKYINEIVSNRRSHLSVYDLEAVKNRNSDPGSHLLYTLQFQFEMDDFVMNESEIAFNGHYENYNRSVTVLKFAHFNFGERKSSDLKENSEDNEHVKMRIVRDPCV